MSQANHVRRHLEEVGSDKDNRVKVYPKNISDTFSGNSYELVKAFIDKLPKNIFPHMEFHELWNNNIPSIKTIKKENIQEIHHQYSILEIWYGGILLLIKDIKNLDTEIKNKLLNNIHLIMKSIAEAKQQASAFSTWKSSIIRSYNLKTKTTDINVIKSIIEEEYYRNIAFIRLLVYQLRDINSIENKSPQFFYSELLNRIDFDKLYDKDQLSWTNRIALEIQENRKEIQTDIESSNLNAEIIKIKPKPKPRTKKKKEVIEVTNEERLQQLKQSVPELWHLYGTDAFWQNLPPNIFDQFKDLKPAWEPKLPIIKEETPIVPKVDNLPVVVDPPKNEDMIDFDVNKVLSNTRRELVWTISDVWTTVIDMANLAAEERLRADYHNSNIFRKASLFFNRWTVLDRYKKEELAINAKSSFDKYAQDQRMMLSDRYQFEQTYGLVNINKVAEIYSDDINILVNSYVNWDMDEEKFKNEFEYIIRKNTEIKEKLDKNKIDYIWTNILSQLKVERQYRTLVQDSISLAEKYKNWTVTAEERDKVLNTKILNFISDHKNYDYLKSQFNIDPDKDSVEKIVKYFKYQIILDKIKQQSFHIKLNILKWGNRAVDYEKKHWLLYRMWDSLDHHPFLTIIGLSWILIGSSFIAGPVSYMVAGSLGIWWLNFIKKYKHITDEVDLYEKRKLLWVHKEDYTSQSWWSKKYWSFKSNINKKVFNGKRGEAYDKVNAAFHRLADNTSAFKRKILWRRLSRSYNYEHIKWKWIDMTIIHNHFVLLSSLNKRLNLYLNSIESKSVNKLKLLLITALVRLDMWNETWHNYFRVTKWWDIESDFYELEKNIVIASQRLKLSLKDLRNSYEYNKLKTKLSDDYKYNYKEIERKRMKDSVVSGVKFWSLFLLSSLAMQFIFSKWLYAKELSSSVSKFYINIDPSIKSQIPSSIINDPVQVKNWLIDNWYTLVDNDVYKTVATSTTTTSLWVDPKIATDLESIMWTQKYNQFTNHLTTSTTHSNLWDILVKDIYHDTKIGNDIKNKIMWIILNATDIVDWVEKPELMIEASKHWIINDITTHSRRIDKVITLMHKWWYTDVNFRFIKDAITNVNNWNWSIYSLQDRIKISEILFCYVHTDWVSQWSPIWKVFMDQITNTITNSSTEKVWSLNTIVETVVNEPKGDWLGYLAVPWFSNTFLYPKIV